MSELQADRSVGTDGFRVPPGWLLVSVGDVANYINGMAFKPTDWEERGRPIIRIQNLTDTSKPYNFTSREVLPKWVVSPGTILVSWSATLDTFIWRGPEAVLNQHIFRVDPNLQLVTHGFLYWQLKRVIREMWESEHTHGSTMKHINRGPFLAHSFRLVPLSEQHRIVAEIETQFTRLDAAVATLEKVQVKLKAARASVLKAAVEGRLVPTEADLARAEGRSYEPASVLLDRILAERKAKWPKGKKYKPPVEPDTEGLPELPEGWVWATLSHVVAAEANAFTDGPFGSKLKSSHYVDEGVRVIRLGNLGVGEFKHKDRSFVTEEHAETLARHWVEAGDLLIAALAEPVGRCCQVPKSILPALVKADCVRLKPAPSVNRLFLMHWMNSPTGRKNAEAHSHGVGRLRINMKNMRELAVPLAPEAEQTRIVAEVERRLSVLDALEATVERNLLRCTRLRQSILKRAFEGKLVPQDPNDEPASALLARIQAQTA